MEWLNVLSNLVGNLGFPIVCCGALFWYVTKHTDKQHEEIVELRETVDRNTDILTDLKELINLMVNHYDKK